MQNGNVREYQSKTQSLSEQIIAQFITLILAMVMAELFVYEMFGMEVTTLQNIGFMIYFFIQNVFIRYFIRRHFEK